MTFSGKFVTAALAAALTSGATLPASSASDPIPAPAPVVADAPQIAAPAPPVELPIARPAPSPVPAMAPIPDEAPEPAPRRTASADMDGELECLAKVVLHEAGNQGRVGMTAVAEVVMNRLKNPRFPKTICGVILQRGQFFNVHAYNGRRDPRWSQAVAIARAVRDGESGSVTNGALFFRNQHGAPFRGRTRVATIGAHAFYR
jgi:spore germination cell wall hydrolase CwlJ-like protein